MTTMKKLLVSFLCLMLLFTVAACSNDDAGGDEKDKEPTLNAGDANCAHSWSSWEVKKENSCTKKGKQLRSCEECGKEEEQVLPAYGHTFYGGECEDCGKKAKDCDHEETELVVISEATCTESGMEREICTRCDAAIDVNYVSALGHPETETVVIFEPTCTEDGQEHEICKICGEVADVNYIWANGHEYEYHEGQDPTCTEKGWYSYYTCSVCDYIDDYEEREPTGHSYRAGTCSTCGFVDPSFELITVPGIAGNVFDVVYGEAVQYDGTAAVIELHSGNITTKGQVDKYTFTAERAGRYYVWIDEVYAGNNFDLYVLNSLGATVTRDTYAENGTGLYMDLEAGTYTVEMRQDSGFSTYNLHIGHAKAVDDISGYDVLKENMEFFRQTNKYTFIPTVSGVYSFYFADMVGNAEMAMAMYNHLNERVGYSGYLGNGEGLKLELIAGETYTLHIENAYNSLTPYTLNIGKQTATVDITDYFGVNDTIYFPGQTNIYTFVAAGSNYRIEFANIMDNGEVDLYVYNYLGERVNYATYCGNGEGLTLTDLVEGQTYTIKVIHRNAMAAYTLNLYSPKAPVEISSDMAVKDSLEYTDQVNTYKFVADRDGDHSFMFLINSYEDYSYVSVSIYDANGNRVKYDTSVYDGNYFLIEGVTAGTEYTILVSVYRGDVEYILSIQ